MNSLSTFLELKYLMHSTCSFKVLNIWIFSIFSVNVLFYHMIIIDSISITLFIFRAVCVCTSWVGAAHLECDAQTFVFSVCASHSFSKYFYFENKKNTVNLISMEWAAHTKNWRVFASHSRCSAPAQLVHAPTVWFSQLCLFSSFWPIYLYLLIMFLFEKESNANDCEKINNVVSYSINKACSGQCFNKLFTFIWSTSNFKQVQLRTLIESFYLIQTEFRRIKNGRTFILLWTLLSVLYFDYWSKRWPNLSSMQTKANTFDCE